MRSRLIKIKKVLRQLKSEVELPTVLRFWKWNWKWSWREGWVVVRYSVRHPRKFWNALSAKSQKWAFRGLVALLIILIGVPTSFWLTSRKAEAGWWNDSWGYRKSIAVTNSSGGTLTDFQVKVLANVDLSADITAGKIQADLDDLRFTDINGKLLPYWIEDTTTNSVDVWVKMPSVPTTGATVYFYYGNSNATAYSDGNRVFEFFDDFSGSSIDSSKWAQGTIASTSGTDFSQSSGNLIGGSNSRYIQSIKSFSGDYSAETRSYTTTQATNGYSPVGFYASSSNSFGILDHAGISYYRNDTGWTGFAFNGNSQWSRSTAKVVGTNATYSRVGETSGSATGTSITNSGISGEYIRLSARYDDSVYDQNYAASWDWVFVRKAASTDPSAASPGTEEKGTGPVAYWAFDEGQGIVADDSVSSNGVIATGGTITDVGGYRIHTFTSSGTFTVTKGGAIEYLLVGGGGGGSNTSVYDDGAGGGAGGLLQGATTVGSQAYTITVGTGGAVQTNGNNSVALGMTAVGGGAGSGHRSAGSAGGSGGGGGGQYSGSDSVAGGAGTAGPPRQGYDGGTKTDYPGGSGGGGAGEAGQGGSGQNKKGGDGILSSINGTATYYAGGGGGSVDGVGGQGGGGAGGVAGTDGLGGGGGGGNTGHAKTAQRGGSGVFIVRYPLKTGNDGTLTNMSATASPTSGWQTEDNCISGKCLAFDGTDDYVSGFPREKQTSTIEWWAKTGTGGYFLQQSFWNDSSNWFEFMPSIRTDTGQIQIWAYSAISGAREDFNVSTASGDYRDNKWHHYAVYFSGGTGYFYLDGNLIGSDAFAFTAWDTATNYATNVGRARGYNFNSGTYYYFPGKLDEVKMYNYARSAAQIKMDYSVGQTGSGGAEGTEVSIGAKSQKWMTDGLLGYWKMDEASGNCTDSSGNGITGTANGTTVAAGKFGNGRQFNGSSDNVAISYTNPVTATSVVAWFKRTGAPAGGYHIITGGQNIEISIPDPGGQIRTGVTTDAMGRQVFNSGSGLVDGNWHQVAMTYDGANLKSFIDGAQTASNPVSGNLSGTAGEIGRYLSNSYVANGIIDETRIYKRALSPKEISDLYNFAPGPVGWWKMDEKTGIYAYDASGNSNTGTLTNGPIWAQGKYGGATSLDGTDDYVTFGNALNIEKNDFAIEGWVKLNSVSGNVSFVEKLESTARTYQFALSSGKLYFNYNYDNNYAYTVGNTSLTTGVWYHIAASVSRSTGYPTVYLNGVNDGYSSHSLVGSPSTTSMTNTGNLNFGRTIYTGYTGYTNGAFDDFKIYNYARSAKQIVEDLNAGHPAGGSPVGSQVGYWKFDEGQGGTANNSGNGGAALNGTITGGTWNNNGKFGKALSFSSSGYMYTAAATLNNAFTFSAWFKPTSFVGWAAVLTNLTYSAPSSGLNIIPQSGSLRICYGDGVNAYTYYDVSASEIVTGQWNYASVVYDGTNVKLYINGVLKDSRAATIAQSSQVIRSGIWASNYGGYLYDGLIDEAKVYNYALTADEVKLDYNHGSAMVVGSSGTTSTGVADNSSSREYCVPGDSTTCNPPIVDWKLDEKTGLTANDTSGNSRNLTLSSGTVWTQGKKGAALDFDRGDYAYDDWADFTLSNQTIEFWIKPRSLSGGWEDLVGTYLGTDVNRFHFYPTSSQICWYSVHGSCGTLTSGVVPVVGQWYHVVGTTDGTNAKIYINGQLKNSMACSGSHTATGVYLAGPSGETFDGQIDDVKIFDYARTASQIAWDYNRGGPVGWWKMDEGEGGTVNNSGTGAGNATWSGTPAWVSGRINGATNLSGQYLVHSTTGLSSINGAVSAWVKPLSGTDNYWGVWQTHDSSSVNFLDWIWLGRYGSTFYFRMGNGSDCCSNDTTFDPTSYFPSDQWTHITATWSGDADSTADDTMTVYVNGVQVAQRTNVNLQATMDPSARIGFGHTYTADGYMDDVRVYNYALTPLQVKDLYNGGAVNFR